jgi:hypothetical protein
MPTIPEFTGWGKCRIFVEGASLIGVISQASSAGVIFKLDSGSEVFFPWSAVKKIERET